MSQPMSASDQVYRHVRELILDGQIGSGELITEGQFVEATGLSRTPVREAFLRLEAEGWLKLYPKRGALVVPVQPEEKEQVLEARQLIETHAMTTIAASADAAQALRRRLLDITEQMRVAMDAGDIETFTTLDAEFHLVIVNSSGNDILADIYRGLRDRLRRMTTRSVWHDKTRMQAIVTDHTDLAEIVSQRDVAAFSTRLMEHMRSIHDRAHRR
ncbi:GntR family transcriptional regulator [Microbacterium sp. A82]|uniref:GntR family transcriptional regulator n=1 Tax=Microbacterium sp. A82 TaxID=3450452 RepID=UPI003F3C056C